MHYPVNLGDGFMCDGEQDLIGCEDVTENAFGEVALKGLDLYDLIFLWRRRSDRNAVRVLIDFQSLFFCGR